MTWHRKHTPIPPIDKGAKPVIGEVVVRKWTPEEKAKYMNLPSPTGKAPVMVRNNPRFKGAEKMDCTKENYELLASKGLKDSEIYKKFGLNSQAALCNRKKKWGGY